MLKQKLISNHQWQHGSGHSKAVSWLQTIQECKQYTTFSMATGTSNEHNQLSRSILYSSIEAESTLLCIISNDYLTLNYYERVSIFSGTKFGQLIPSANWSGLDPSGVLVMCVLTQVWPMYVSSSMKAYLHHITRLVTKLAVSWADFHFFCTKVNDHLKDTGMDSISYLLDPHDCMNMIFLVWWTTLISPWSTSSQCGKGSRACWI